MTMMNRRTRAVTIGLLLLAVLLSSCRRLPKAGPTLPPTITPTPRSTELPPVATPIPPGSEENPIHLKIVAPPDSSDGFDVAISALDGLLLDATGAHVAIETVTTDAEALTALCDSPSGTVSAAWLGGLAYAAAHAQGCGSAALEVERGAGSAARVGDEALIVVNAALDINGVADLAGHSFCRLGYTDVYSWMVPELLLKAAGVQPTDLTEIRDYSDTDVLLSDVASGTCDAAGIASSQFDASSAARSSLRTLQQSVTVPYAVLVVPPELSAAQAQALAAALVSIGNGSRADMLKLLLSQDQLVEVSDADLAALRSAIARAGVDLARAES